MKEFLHVSGDATVVALDDRAYAALRTDEKVKLFELSVPKSTDTNDNNSQAQKNINPYSVQAVSSHWSQDKNALLCAISRYDKSLSVYSISVNDVADKINPIVVHKTNKRCCALTFASIPYEEKSKGSLDMIVSADLAGDVNAFPVVAMNSKTVQRLLLGHTASMLTAIKIFDGKLFSADRDEKVRISTFPETYKVEGYLLGNTEYITDMDVFQTENNNKYCVTASGDCTIRLWDYESCNEISCMNLAAEEGKESEKKNEEEESSNDVSEQAETKTSQHIPVRITANGKGNLIAIIYNERNVVDLFAVKNNGASGPKLEKIQSMKCLNPLAVAFGFNGELCVLTKEPKYIVYFAKNSDGIFSTMEECKLSSAIRSAGEASSIFMPTSIIETDEVTGKIKLMKNIKEEGEGYVEHKPWLNGERKQKKKDKEKRRKNRRLNEEIAAKKELELENDQT